jgi:soluble lytic murein transglycosylase
MQGIDGVLSRITAVRAFIAGAAILAGAVAPDAQAHDALDGAQGDVALAVPHVLSLAHAPVALPQPLPPSEVKRIRHILELQRTSAALSEGASPADGPLAGPVEADRLLRLGAAAGTEPLRAWLAPYSDLPDAAAIYALLLTQLPRGAAPPPAPPPVGSLTPGAAVTAPDDVDLTGRELDRDPDFDRSVLDTARAGHADRAIRLIAHARSLDHLYGAVLRAEVAQILFTQGRDHEAFSLAEGAHRQASGVIGLAPYVAGLAAWRMDHADVARSMFAASYRAPLSSPSRRSGAAFWAARAELRCHNLAGYSPWMQRAAENPQAFYGLIARRALGRGAGTARPFAGGTLGEADVDAIAATPQGNRAFALLQVGQFVRAEAELRQLWAATRGQPGFSRSILLVAQAAGLDNLAAQLAPLVQAVGEGAAMHLPTMGFRPTGGFRIDPALMYGLARLESNFDPQAVSPAGARGLMQIMPITLDQVLRDSPASPNRVKLHDPATNLDLGQRYLIQLARFDSVAGDLIRLLASYNAGPGSYARWAGTIRHEGDPLLFIESVPLDETRAYIPRALSLTWLYAAQLGLPAPSLDEIAAGGWPTFEERAPDSDLPRPARPSRGLVAQLR